MRTAEQVRDETDRHVLRLYWGFPGGLFIMLAMLVWIGMVKISPLAWMFDDFLGLATSADPADQQRMQFLSGFSWLLLALPSIYWCYRLDIEDLEQVMREEDALDSPA